MSSLVFFVHRFQRRRSVTTRVGLGPAIALCTYRIKTCHITDPTRNPGDQKNYSNPYIPHTLCAAQL